MQKSKIALCITVPKSTLWSDYEKELEDVKDGRLMLNFKVPTYPKKVKEGDRCYVVHNGFIKGWMTITGIIDRSSGFDCQTTGRQWGSGIYVCRSGEFHYLSKEVPMKGFQGYRYIDEIN